MSVRDSLLTNILRRMLSIMTCVPPLRTDFKFTAEFLDSSVLLRNAVKRDIFYQNSVHQSVCPSVRPSHSYVTLMVEDIKILSVPHDRAGCLYSFLRQNFPILNLRVHPERVR